MSLEVQVKKKRKGATSGQSSHTCRKVDNSIHLGLQSPDVKVGAKYRKSESIGNLQLLTVWESYHIS